MELTPAEKQKIYEEEKARLEAQEQVKKEQQELKNKNTNMGCLVLIGIFLFLAFIGSFCGNKTTETALKDPATARREMIESKFSGWDGSHINLTQAIKDSMNDPKSYEHVKTTYIDKGDYLIVKTVFRGKNAFGGVVVNSVSAKVGLDGRILQILSQE